MDKTIIIVVSPLGLGHATRQIALKDAFLDLDEEVKIKFVCNENQDSLLRRAILTSDRVSIETIPHAPQLTMEDWTTVDTGATIESFKRTIDFDTQVREDREWERIFHGGDLIINDIESIANPIAKKMGIEIVNISNFTWSDIIGQFADDELKENYVKLEMLADHHLRLPFHTKCQGFKNPEDVGLLVRSPDMEHVENVRSSTFKPIVYLSYSRREWDFDINDFLIEFLHAGFKVMIMSRFVPEEHEDKVIKLRADEPRTQDFIATADIIVSKIGYSIVSEALSNGKPILHWKRENYVEDDVLSQAIIDRNQGETLPLDVTPKELIDKIYKYMDDEYESINNGTNDIAKRVLSIME